MRVSVCACVCLLCVPAHYSEEGDLREQTGSLVPPAILAGPAPQERGCTGTGGSRWRAHVHLRLPDPGVAAQVSA